MNVYKSTMVTNLTMRVTYPYFGRHKTVCIRLQVTMHANKKVCQKQVQHLCSVYKTWEGADTIVQAVAYCAVERACQRKGIQSVLTSIGLVYLYVNRCASVQPMSWLTCWPMCQCGQFMN